MKFHSPGVLTPATKVLDEAHAFDGDFVDCSIPCSVAGGMGRKGDRVSLHERIHGTPQPREPAAPAVKHCWVTDRHGRLPGLLLEWRRTASGWQGRVVRPALEGDDWIVVEEWLPAELLDQG